MIDDFTQAQWTPRRDGALWTVIEQLGENKYWFGPFKGPEVQSFITWRRAIIGKIIRRRLQKQKLAA